MAVKHRETVLVALADDAIYLRQMPFLPLSRKACLRVSGSPALPPERPSAMDRAYLGSWPDAYLFRPRGVLMCPDDIGIGNQYSKSASSDIASLECHANRK